MPKVSQTDILTLILRDLDQIIETQKKAGAGSVPEPTSKAAQAEASALGGTLSNLAVSLKMLSKISTKDVDHILYTLKTLHTAIKGFKLTKSDAEGFSHTLSAITSLTSTFGNMSEGIWDLMKKYNPIRGRMLGKRIAKFYKGIIQGFEKEKLMDYIKLVAALGGENKEGSAANITAFSGLLTGLFSIDPKKVVLLSASLKLLSPKDGKKLADFISPIIEVIKNMPKEVLEKNGEKEGWKENPNITAFIGLFNALASITFASVLRIWTMSKLLGPKNGEALAGFFTELLKPFSAKNTVEAALNFRKVVNTFNITMITLVACLAIITLLIVSKPKEFLIGLSITAALVAGVYTMIKFLSSKSIQKSAKESLYTVTGILMLIGGLTLVLLLTMHIAKEYPLKDIGTGILILAGIVLFSVGVMWFLSSNKFKKQSKEALWGVAAIVLMFTGMALAMFITISIGKDADQILKGAGIVLLYTAIAAGIFILISKFLKPKTILSGLMGVGAIIVMTASISLAMLLFSKFLEKLNGLENKTILWGIGLTIGMIAGIGGIAFAAGGLIMGPLAALFFAGFAVVEMISVMIASVSGAMLLFANLLNNVKEISKEDIKETIEKFISKDGLISALSQIVSGLANFGMKAAIKAGIISHTIRPVISTIGQFVDIVQKMASLKIADEWDKNGKPTHYLQLTPSAFKDAADNLTEAFSTFLMGLSKGLETIGNADYLRKVIDALFPSQQGGFFSLFKKTKKLGIGDIIPVISKFVDIIIKYASMTIPTEWNKNGVPIKYRKVENKEFEEAAKTVTNAFKIFLTGLSDGLNQISNAPYLAFIIGQLFPSPKKAGLFSSKMVEQPGIGTVIQTVSEFMDIIIRIASARVPDKWDKNGNPIHYRKIKNSEFIKAAKTVTKCFTTFLTQLSEELKNNISPLGAAVIKLISKSGIDVIMTSFGNIMNPILQIAAGKLLIGDKVVDIDKNALTNAPKDIIAPMMEMLTSIRQGFSAEKGNMVNAWYQAKIGTEYGASAMKHLSAMIESIFKADSGKALIDQVTTERRSIMTDTLILFSDIRDKFNESGWKAAGKAAKHLKKISEHIKESINNIFSKNTIDLVTSDNITKISDYMNLISGIVKYINDTNFSNRKSLQFKLTLKYTSSGLDTLTKSLTKFLPISNLIRKNVLLEVPKDIDKVTKSIQKLDATLIGNQQKRIEAIQTMSDKFAEVSKSIEDLNKSMAQSNRIIREFEGEKESRSFSIFGHLADRFNVVDKIKSNVEDTAIAAKALADELSKRNQKAPEIDTAAIVAAITTGLNDWVESQKIVNITFGEDDAKRIVGIIGES